MKTQYYTAATVNGFIADEHDSLEWLFQFGEIESMQNHYPRFIAQVGALAMGATTYEWILRHERMLENPQNWPYTLPTWVFTHRQLPAVPGADIRFAEGDVRPIHEQMSAVARGKNVWLAGGGDLVGQFHDQGLLDEIIVSVAPVMLAAGAPLLPRSIATPPLKLQHVEQHGDVFAILTYAVTPQGDVPGA
ncbi:MAG TPA: dihydrofolate reductase family protein [Phycisphaerae bacterium]|nr:dihydrofolate reductase family protein [Phycisphaerae bacterium]